MYAKLFSRIAQSSLMEEDINTRYVFMMLLALADQQGNVIGTDIAIARMMNLSKKDFLEAMEALKSPDPDSNSPDHEGRRVIASEEGRGYRLVNYLSYRAIKSNDEKRAYMREYMRKRRAQELGNVKPVKPCKTPLSDVTQAEAEAEAEAETTSSVSADTDEKGILLDLWNNSPKWSRQRSSKKMVYEAWKKIKKSERPNREELVKSIKAWSNCEEWTRDGGQYAQGLHLWIKAQRWESNPDPVETAKIFDQRRQQAQEARPF